MLGRNLEFTRRTEIWGYGRVDKEMCKRVSKFKILESKVGPGVCPNHRKFVLSISQLLLGDYFDFSYISVNSYGHFETVISPNKPVFLDKLD